MNKIKYFNNLLKRCPLCGKKVLLEEREEGFSVSCKRCKVSTSIHLNEITAVYLWNHNVEGRDK